MNRPTESRWDQVWAHYAAFHYVRAYKRHVAALTPDSTATPDEILEGLFAGALLQSPPRMTHSPRSLRKHAMRAAHPANASKDARRAWEQKVAKAKAATGDAS